MVGSQDNDRDGTIGIAEDQMPNEVTTYATLTQAADAIGVDRKTAFKMLKARKIMIENYEGRLAIAAGLGVEMNSVRDYMRKGKLAFTRVGATVIAAVGQFGEQDLPGWPDVPRKKYWGPRVGDDVIVPHMSRARKTKTKAKAEGRA